MVSPEVLHDNDKKQTDASSSIVSLCYKDLITKSPVAIEAAQSAFCHKEGFGALILMGIPHWTECRKNLLESGSALTFGDARHLCEGEHRVAPGWKGSPGNETHSLQSGFYANLKAESNKDENTATIWGENKWPDDTLKSTALKEHFTEAGNIMYELTLLVLDLAQEGLMLEIQKIKRDNKVLQKNAIPNLRNMAEKSTFLPSRLVYYDANYSREDVIEGGSKEFWLPWHVDFNLATALAPASWIKEETALLDGRIEFDHDAEKETGLLLRSGSGIVVPAALEEDSVIIQLGALCHFSSGGLLRAGPHAVAKDKSRKGMGRLSYGIFVYEPMDAKMKPSAELLHFLTNANNDASEKGMEESNKVLFTNDYGRLLEKSYTGETVFDGFKKFETYMNSSI